MDIKNFSRNSIAGKGGGVGKCTSSHVGGIERGSSFSSHLVVC